MTKYHEQFSRDNVKEILDYDPETGDFRWKWQDHMRPQRNARYAGKSAGSINDRGYLGITIHGRLYRAHRIAWLISYGKWPEDQIDHINGDRSDNRILNLRAVTSAENRRNSARPSNNTSGTVGVRWHKRDKKWMVMIGVNGNDKHIGCFTTIEEAVAARKAAEITHGYHSNHGRAAS